MRTRDGDRDRARAKARDKNLDGLKVEIVPSQTRWLAGVRK